MTAKSKGKPAAELHLAAYPGESNAKVMARSALQPTVRAAFTANAYRVAGMDDLDLTELVDELSAQCDKTRVGDLGRPEAMLTAQAHTLDAIFNRLAMQAAGNVGHYPETVDIYLRLGLRAQAQCRATLEALAAIKNPPVVFARQANIAHGPQQINNGVAAESARTEETTNQPIELLENNRGEWMDAGATSAAGRGDPIVETVGEVDRPAERRGKGGGEQ